MANTNRYSEDVLNWARANAYGRTTRELAELFNESEISLETGYLMTFQKMKSLLSNHRISTGGHKKGRRYSKKFPKEVSDFIEANVKGIGEAKLAEITSKEFGRKFTAEEIGTFKKNHKLSSGLSGKFQKGHVPPNKGKKGIINPGCKVGWFKAGNVPHNAVPIGAETVTTDGYLRVKVGNPNYWVFSHQLVWMSHNGDIPNGYIVTFLDGDKRNLDIANLALITRREHMGLLRHKLRSEEPELTACGIQTVRLINKINDIRADKHGGGK